MNYFQSEFAEIPSKQSNKHGFISNQVNNSVSNVDSQWNTKESINYDGVKPPLKQLKITNVDNKNKNPLGVVFQIDSARQPYKVQYMFNKYGGLNSKLGTNL